MVVKCKEFSGYCEAVDYVNSFKNPDYEWDSVTTAKDTGITVYSFMSPEKWLEDYNSIHYVLPVINEKYIVITVYPYRVEDSGDYDT